MPQIEFRRFEGRGLKVLHWPRHDPNELLDALERAPVHVVGTTPPVRVHKFGNQLLAVRAFRRGDGFEDLLFAFGTLADAAKSRAAFVELPVALVANSASEGRIVTLWKKDSRPLDEFLADNRIPMALRERACLSAARKLAKLHAAGFVHGHVNPDNFLADSRGNASLIDYTYLHRNNLDVDPAFIDSASMSFRAIASGFLRGHRRDGLVLRMQHAYEDTRDRFAGQFVNR